MKIGIACDHAGYETKEEIIKYLEQGGHKVTNFGTNSAESMDYPDTAHPLAIAVENKELEMGISICGSGNGINMTANKHQGIRAALCWTTEISKLAREHNNANICSLPARFISISEAKQIVDTFLVTKFEGGRHQRRLEKMPLK